MAPTLIRFSFENSIQNGESVSLHMGILLPVPSKASSAFLSGAFLLPFRSQLSTKQTLTLPEFISGAGLSGVTAQGVR